MQLTVVIPTRNRRSILIETLSRLERQAGDATFEVIVIDDGSTDGSREAARGAGAALALDLVLLEQDRAGASAARNRALGVARAPVCLFMNDDSWPRPDLVARHAAFHAREPAPTAALLGSITLPAQPPPTPFMRWLADLHFGYDGIRDPKHAGGARFFTANVSAKASFLREAGGFDESFPAAGHEDIDLGLRLEQRGMRLVYDPAAVVEHAHPMDLPGAIDRMYEIGRRLPRLVERHPTWPAPRRPGARHRVKAAGLTGLTALGARTPGVQHEVWRFLCHEAAREGYWSVADTRGPTRHSTGLPRIGRRLAELASRDADATLPS